MAVKLILGFLLLGALGLNAFIIPDELPSILSVIYSNIPTLKKGTDSRVGWGFRLGDRADFQVLVELGPQTNTRPLANQGENTNKRNTLNNLANTLYAQRQQEKKEKEQKENNAASNSEAAKWLQTWSKTTTTLAEEENETVPLKPKPGIAIGEIDAKSVIPDDSTQENLEKQRLKPKKQVNIKKPTSPKSLLSLLTEGDTSTTNVPSTTEKEKPLDDVSLDKK